MNSRRLIGVGVAATAIVLGAALVPLLFLTADANSYLQNLANLGQFISGVFAPLAFVWVVVAVLLQSRELELQRKELVNSRRALELQYEELKKTVEQHVEQTNLMRIDSGLRQTELETKGLEERVLDTCSKLLDLESLLHIYNKDGFGVLFHIGEEDILRELYYRNNYVAFFDTVYRSIEDMLGSDPEKSLTRAASSFRNFEEEDKILLIEKVVLQMQEIERGARKVDRINRLLSSFHFVDVCRRLERLVLHIREKKSGS